MKTEMIAINTGMQIEYALSGPPEGETLLFVHGLGANLRQFEPQQRFFQDEYRVLLVSLRGHGRSASPPQPTPANYAVKALAQDIRAFLHQLEVGRVHFVGNSLGGLVGYELLKLDAGWVSSLTTFGATAELHASPFLLWTQLALIWLLGAKGMAWLVSKTASPDKAVAAQVGQMFQAATKDALALITGNIADYDYTGIIHRHDLPMLLIRGGRDREINARLGSTLAAWQGKRGFKLVELPGAGHFANMEHPAVFNDVLADFLREKTNRKGAKDAEE